MLKNLETYFKEKDLPLELFEIDVDGETHLIDNVAVIGAIGHMSIELQKKIRDKITTIDFCNGNINYFLKDIAIFLIKQNQQ